MTKVLVLLSGGLDSSCALAVMALNYGAENVECLSFNYGSIQHKEEQKAISRMITLFDVKHTEIDLSSTFKDLSSSLISGKGEEYEVPFRNPIFIAIATSIAMQKNIQIVTTGIHAGCDQQYFDCSIKHSHHLNHTVMTGSGNKVNVVNPFLRQEKEDIIQRGVFAVEKLNLSVAEFISAPYSCYKGTEKHCGTCPTCKERARGFEKAGIEIPNN